MVPWWWLFVAVSIGGIIGVMVIALCIVSGRMDDNRLH